MTTAAVAVSLPPSTPPQQRIQHFSQAAVEVNVQSANDLDETLNYAVMLVLTAAIEHRTGILVTRMDVGRYIVGACPDVPVGLTRQRYF